MYSRNRFVSFLQVSTLSVQWWHNHYLNFFCFIALSFICYVSLGLRVYTYQPSFFSLNHFYHMKSNSVLNFIQTCHAIPQPFQFKIFPMFDLLYIHALTPLSRQSTIHWVIGFFRFFFNRTALNASNIIFAFLWLQSFFSLVWGIFESWNALHKIAALAKSQNKLEVHEMSSR